MAFQPPTVQIQPQIEQQHCSTHELYIYSRATPKPHKGIERRWRGQTSNMLRVGKRSVGGYIRIQAASNLQKAATSWISCYKRCGIICKAPLTPRIFVTVVFNPPQQACRTYIYRHRASLSNIDGWWRDSLLLFFTAWILFTTRGGGRGVRNSSSRKENPESRVYW